MKNIADLLLEYWDTADQSVLGVEKSIEKKDLDAIVLGILSWLKLERKREIWIEQGRRTKLKDMELFSDAPWCVELKTLTENDDSSVFSQFFCVNGRYLNFKEEISPQYRHESRELAYTKYNPQRMIH